LLLLLLLLVLHCELHRCAAAAAAAVWLHQQLHCTYRETKHSRATEQRKWQT
jgi:hypothetical protein